MHLVLMTPGKFPRQYRGETYAQVAGFAQEDHPTFPATQADLGAWIQEQGMLEGSGLYQSKTEADQATLPHRKRPRQTQLREKPSEEAQRLRDVRLKRGLSQEHFGLALGLEPGSAQNTIGRYERGKRAISGPIKLLVEVMDDKYGARLIKSIQGPASSRQEVEA